MRLEKVKSIEQIDDEVVSKFNQSCNSNLNDVSDVLNILSKRFEQLIDELGDAQDAYYDLCDQYPDVMESACFTYSLFGDGCWSVGTGSNYKEEDLSKYIELINSTFNWSGNYKDKTLDDILSTLDNRVSKDMSNAGCDMFTALEMILEEDLSDIEEDVFVITGANCSPRIEILY